MDQILHSYQDKFINDENLQHLDKSSAFEYFVIRTLISRIHPDYFDCSDIVTGSGLDNGIDGLAIIVNDHIIGAREDIDHFRETQRRFDVKFVFIQAKDERSFESGGISKFMDGVARFFSKKSSVPMNQKLTELRSLKDYIYQFSYEMDNLPSCEMYYATVGKWTDDLTLSGLTEEKTCNIESTKLFEIVKFNPVDGDRLKSFYREQHRKVSKEIKFDNHTSMSAIKDVFQAYIGVLPATEYLKLITSEGNLMSSIFYDNVRDFQGYNSVNTDIELAIQNQEYSDRFALLNNGITIVAKSVKQVGVNFTIRDYQVVNGCQTSHILFLNKDKVTSDMSVPLKLIVTSNVEVTSQIIEATNNQTEVRKEAFESIKNFHKNLEEFYKAIFDNKRPLYYERRSKQYAGLEIDSSKVISLATQIKCFLGMFLNDPHSTHRYYGELLKANREKLFQEEHNYYPYYCSGYAYIALQKLFAQKIIDNKKYRAFSFHLLMLLRLLIDKSPLPYLNSKKIEKRCEKLCNILWDKDATAQVFLKASSVLDLVLENGNYTRDEAPRRKAFTIDLVSHFNIDSSASTIQVEKNEGVIYRVVRTRGFGFIKSDLRKEIFFHFNDVLNAKEGFELQKDDLVRFTVVENDKGLNAKSIELINRPTST
jgi:cold shock CspA family protein